MKILSSAHELKKKKSNSVFMFQLLSNICFIMTTSAFLTMNFLLRKLCLWFYIFYCIVLMMQSSNGLGLQAARGGDYCQVTLKFPSDTIPKWVGSSMI